MRRAAATVVIALILAACTQADPAGTDPAPSEPAGPAPAPSGSAEPDPTSIEIYTAAFRSLAETERWFAPVLLDERICPGIADVGQPLDRRCEGRFTQAEQTAILAELSDLPGVRFVDDPERVQDRIFRGGGLRRAGLLTVGVIDGDDERVTVGGRSYCGGLCAHWMTLVLRNGAQGWEVTGTTGPIAVA
jgi:hypothetical protein